MCGIVAYLCEKPCSFDQSDRLRNATDALRHRGPDDQGFWTGENGQVGLGHRRLSVHGGPDAKQPIHNRDRTLCVVVNGELYDPHEELRHNLVRRGHRFVSQSDSELAIHLYLQHGLGFVHYLRGEFAVLLYDANLHRLIAVRDRFGIKPLVYSQIEDQWWFASQVRALAAAGKEILPDHESAWHATSFQYTLPDRTMAKDVFQLLPGEMAVVAGGRMHKTKYWDLDYPRRGDCPPDTQATDDALVAEFEYRFADAVQMRLRGDVPVVAHLSGGVDSCSVLFAGLPNVDAAFTVGFPGADGYDEEPIARMAADRAGVPLHTVCGDIERLIEALPHAVSHSEGWAVNGHLPAKFLLNQAIANAGYKVALTGEGADELVAGYPHLRVDEGRANGLDIDSVILDRNPASRGIMLATGRGLDLRDVHQRLGYLPAFLEAKASLGLLLRSHLRDDFSDAFAGRDAYCELLDAIACQDQLRDRHVVHQSLYLWNKTALPQYILRTLGDGCESAHGVEGRLPMLDHRLFEWVRLLPKRMLLKPDSSKKGTVEKWILREAMRPRIPPVVANKPKHPFVAPPLSHALCGRGIARDALEAAINSHAYFDAAKTRLTLSRLPTMSCEQRITTDPLWWTILSSAMLSTAMNNNCNSLQATQ